MHIPILSEFLYIFIPWYNHWNILRTSPFHDSLPYGLSYIPNIFFTLSFPQQNPSCFLILNFSSVANVEADLCAVCSYACLSQITLCCVSTSISESDAPLMHVHMRVWVRYLHTACPHACLSQIPPYCMSACVSESDNPVLYVCLCVNQIPPML